MSTLKENVYKAKLAVLTSRPKSRIMHWPWSSGGFATLEIRCEVEGAKMGFEGC